MKLTNAGPKKVLEKPGRHGDGAALYFRMLGGDNAYWVYRYRASGREREFSIGPYPARTPRSRSSTPAPSTWNCASASSSTRPTPSPRDASQRKAQPKRPRLGSLPSAKSPTPHVETKGGQWKNAKHRAQWAMTSTKYCAPIRDMPIDQIDTRGVPGSHSAMDRDARDRLAPQRAH